MTNIEQLFKPLIREIEIMQADLATANVLIRALLWAHPVESARVLKKLVPVTDEWTLPFSYTEEQRTNIREQLEDVLRRVQAEAERVVCEP